MRDPNSRAHANLANLELVARKLGTLNDEVVFLGGATTALFITDPSVPDIRMTEDVDCIVDVISLNGYHQFTQRLTEKGFKQTMADNIICRWRCDDLILDVMPTDENILGFSNYWYKGAIKTPLTHEIAKSIFVKSITPVYFIATKLEAFKTRGKHDYLGSHDFSDIITVVDGRIELLEELRLTDQEVRAYVSKAFVDFLKDDDFSAYLPGHLPYGSMNAARTHMVLDRIKQLAAIFDEKLI